MNLDNGENLGIINRYAKTWQILLQYDEDNFPATKTGQVATTILEIDKVRLAITSLKQELDAKGESTDYSKPKNLIIKRWLH